MKGIIIATVTALTVFLVMADAPSDKWLAPDECLKRLFQSTRVENGKLILKAPQKGIRFLYSINQGEKKLCVPGEDIVIEKGQPIQVYERHVQLEILPVKKEGKTRFAVSMVEDYRSFGKEVTTSVSAFDLGANYIQATSEAEARTSLQEAQESMSAVKK
jgi:hypothetical protein